MKVERERVKRPIHYYYMFLKCIRGQVNLLNLDHTKLFKISLRETGEVNYILATFFNLAETTNKRGQI
jgi:hypothetical protein